MGEREYEGLGEPLETEYEGLGQHLHTQPVKSHQQSAFRLILLASQFSQQVNTLSWAT